MTRRTRTPGIRPRLDRLEARDCPAVTVVQDGRFLHLTGDVADDWVAVCDEGGQEIEVQTARGTETFTDVCWVVGDLGAGNDTFEFHQAERPSRLVDVRLDLGAGDDRFLYPELPGAQPPPEPDRPARYALAVRTGAGNDVMVIQPRIVPGLGFDVRADLGDGNDTFDASYQPDPANPAGAVVPGIELTVEAGAGADTVEVAIGNPDTLAATAMQKVRIGIDTGDGSDVGIFIICNVAVTGRLTQTVDLGAGDDRASLTLDDVAVGGLLKQSAAGGEGGDVVGFIVDGCRLGSVLQSADGGGGGDQVSFVTDGGRVGSLSQAMNLGDGDDAGIIIIGGTPVSGAMVVALDTGRGDDSASIMTQDSVAFDGPVALRVALGDGTDGADVLLRGIELHDQVRVAVATGEGDDRVSARAEQPLFVGPARLAMAVRGGAGANVLDLAVADPTGHQYRGGRAAAELNVTGGGGADRIGVRAGAAELEPDPELRLDWSLSVGGGDENDQIDVVARQLWLTGDPAGRDGSRIAVNGGAGDDRLTARVERPVYVGPADVAVEVWAGAGANILDVAMVDPTGHQYRGGQATADVDVAGGGGTDQITVRAGTEALRPDYGLRLVCCLGVAGGGGDDRLDVLARDLVLAAGPASMVELDGGAGDDRLTARVERPTFIGPARLDVGVGGGTGADVLDVAIIDPLGDQYEEGRARVGLEMSGDDGDDEVRLHGGLQDQPADPHLQLDWVVRLGGNGGRDLMDAGFRFDPAGQDRLTAAVHGGGGDDTIGFDGAFGSGWAGALAVDLGGGDGADVLTSDLTFGEELPASPVRFRMFAGDGDDELFLNLLGGPDTTPEPHLFLLDGGAGFDLARAPAGAVVRNCEGRG